MKTKEEINSEINILLDALQDVGINTPTLRKLIDEYSAQAIAEHEASQWKKYPENKPEKDGYYIATYINGGCSECAYFINSPSFWDYNVIAFRELPTPYREEGEI